ncbi:MFS transporter [Ancylothrix sp. C2]|uniref:MFS transporter n=1 Tax=Ancylothrix sp. D3o TaxID=2953691 RepID=UPI0021BA5405|nr:MFS transporter [Ancylothrix sp. D3o]MCT7949096.1 MFS transporter [Ancylothrix sp. D3o]
MASIWIGNALSFYAFIAIALAESGLGVVLPSIQNTYQLNPATVSLLFLSQMSGYIAAALGSSLLVSKFGLAKTLLLGAISLTSSLFIYAITSSWLVMVLTGTLLGLGIGLIDAGVNTYVASDQTNASITGFLHAFYGIGAVLGPVIATTILSETGNWRTVYLVFVALTGLLVLAMLWATSHYPPMSRLVRESSANALRHVQIALTSKTVILVAILSFVTVGLEASVNNWAYSVENISRGIPAVLAGYSISAYWAGMTLGRLGMGSAVRRLGAIPTLNASLALLLSSLVVWWLFPFQLWSLLFIGLGGGAIFPLTIWLMPQRVNSNLVPAAISFLTSAASLGASGIPTLLGWAAGVVNLAIIPPLMVVIAILMVVIQHLLNRNSPPPTTLS